VKRADIVGSMITIVFGLFAVTQAAQLDYWSPFGPGSGFIPLWASIVLTGGGILLLIQSLLKRQAGVKPPAPDRLRRFLAVASVAALTAGAAVLMDYLGFSISIFLFVLLMVGAIGKHRWHVSLTTAALTAASFYVVFAVWLQVPLPKGLMGF